MSIVPPPTNPGSGGYGYSIGAPLGAPDGRYPGVQYKHRRAAPALACGVLSVLLFGVLAGIPATVMGRPAVRDIAASDGRVGGRSQALADIILGTIGRVLGVVWVAYVVSHR